MQGKDLLAPKYTGIVQATSVVLREEGVLALWKGNGANVLRVVPVYGLKFAFNDSIKAIVAGPGKKRLEMKELLWAGTLAGLFQNALTYPLETVRTRLTLGPEQGVRYRGIADCFRQMVKTEGMTSLCVGLLGGGHGALRTAATCALPHPPTPPHPRTLPFDVAQLQGLWPHHGDGRALHGHTNDEL